MRVTIVSLCDENRREISDATAPTFERFCAIQGIQFVRHTSLINSSLNPFWNKFPAVINELPKNDWVMWVDADVVVTNYDYNLPELIESFGEKNFLVSTDSNGLCNGVFLLRNCEWSYEFVKTLMFLGEVKDEVCQAFNQGRILKGSDQDPIKVLVNNWKSVYDSTGFIPETVINNPFSKVKGCRPFAYHFWAASEDKQYILKRIEEIRRSIYPRQPSLP